MEQSLLSFLLLGLVLSEKESPSPQKDGSWTMFLRRNPRRHRRDTNLLNVDVDVDRDNHVAVGDVLDATKELSCWNSTMVLIAVSDVDEQENVLAAGEFPTYL